MKAAHHSRQPLWSLSSLVLLSALLLSPVTSTALLQAVLTQHLAQIALAEGNGRAVPAGAGNTAVGTVLPRRVSEEEDLLRRAVARAGYTLPERHDFDPETAGTGIRKVAETLVPEIRARTLAHVLLTLLLSPALESRPVLPPPEIETGVPKPSFASDAPPWHLALRNTSEPRAPPA